MAKLQSLNGRTLTNLGEVRPAAGIFGNWWEDWFSIPGVTALAAYQAKNAPTFNDSLTNIANPGTYDLTYTSAPSWSSATGWTFDGVSNFLDTGLAGANENTTVFIQFSGVTGTTGAMIACHNAVDTQRYLFWPNIGGNRRYDKEINSFATPWAASGNMGLSGNTAYFDGVSEGSLGTIPAFSVPYSFYVGARHYAAATDSFFSGNVQAVAIYSGTISAPEALALAGRMAAL